MIKVIIYRPFIQECELRYRELDLARNECIYLYGPSLLCNRNKECAKGYYKQVMVDETVKLDGLSKEDFAKLYNMM